MRQFKNMQINLVKLEDSLHIKTILFKDKLYKAILGNADFDAWEPNLKNTAWFLIQKNNCSIGVIFFTEVSYQLVSIHTGLYKAFRGNETPKIIKLCLDYIKRETNCSFLTTIPSKNKAALQLGKKLNFKIIKTIKNGCVDDDLCLLAEKN